MKPRFVVSAFFACFVALFNSAEESRWYTQPGRAVTLESSGFEFRALLPQGWSFTTEHGFVPPSALESSCRVRGGFHTNQSWDRFLVSKLRSTDGFRTADGARSVMKIGGHPAVSNRYVREPFAVHDIYINLSELQPDSGAVWTFEGTRTKEGTDCGLQFLALIQSARITRRQ